MTLKLKSPAFEDGERIPKDFSGEGADCSPELRWNEPPVGTQEFALICEDPDAPTEDPFVHWIAYHIPANLRSLPKNIAREPEPTSPREISNTGLVQGKNSFGTFGYGGPMPPKGHGPHHYNFTLLALKEPLDLSSGASKEELLEAAKSQMLDRAALVGVYERN